AGVDAHAVADVLGEPRLRLAVALHAEHLESDHHAVADAVAVAGGEITVDAAADRAALGAHADVFDDIEAAVGPYLDHLVVGHDALARLRRSRAEDGKQHQRGGNGGDRARRGAERGQDGACRRAGHRDSSTFTAARLSSSAWKNSAPVKPKLRATSRSGTRCTASL